MYTLTLLGLHAHLDDLRGKSDLAQGHNALSSRQLEASLYVFVPSLYFVSSIA